MYPTTGYTPSLDHATIECNKFETNLELKRDAVLIAEQRVAYLLEIGHPETAHALKEKIDGR